MHLSCNFIRNLEFIYSPVFSAKNNKNITLICIFPFFVCRKLWRSCVTFLKKSLIVTPTVASWSCSVTERRAISSVQMDSRYQCRAFLACLTTPMRQDWWESRKYFLSRLAEEVWIFLFTFLIVGKLRKCSFFRVICNALQNFVCPESQTSKCCCLSFQLSFLSCFCHQCHFEIKVHSYPTAGWLW